MKTMKYSAALQALRDAVAHNIRMDRRIRRVLRQWLSWYAGRAARPKNVVALPASMACEENGASRMLEELLDAVKRFPVRGADKGTLWLMRKSAMDLLEDFHGLADDLPAGLKTLKDQFTEAVSHARDREGAFFNLAQGVSGSGRECTETAYAKRLNQELDRMKQALGLMLGKLRCITDRLEKGEFYRERPVRPSRHRRTQRERTEAENMKHDDRLAIDQEVKRLTQQHFDKTGEYLRPKVFLLQLWDSPVWGARCRQWTFSTLHCYVRTDLGGWRPVGFK